MGAYYHYVNHKRKEKIDPHFFLHGAKFAEIALGGFHGMNNIMSALLSGRWCSANENIELVTMGHYDHYKDVSQSALEDYCCCVYNVDEREKDIILEAFDVAHSLKGFYKASFKDGNSSWKEIDVRKMTQLEDALKEFVTDFDKLKKVMEIAADLI